MTPLTIPPAEALETYSDTEVTVWLVPRTKRTGVVDGSVIRRLDYGSLRAALADVMDQLDDWAQIDVHVHAPDDDKELTLADLPPFFAELRRLP